MAAEPCKVLLVEDYPDTLALVARLLRLAGFLVTCASTIAEALRAAATETFNVAVVDVGLPDGDGCDLMNELRSTHQLTGIALTAYGQPADVARCTRAGYHHMLKPFNIDTFLQSVGQLC